MNRYDKGLFAEWLAAMTLRVKGCRIIAQRFKTGAGTGRAEIDLIARRGKTIIFVEVKNRPSSSAGLIAITPAQQIRLRRAAESWLIKNDPNANARFDVIVVSGLRIRHFKNMI